MVEGSLGSSGICRMYMGLTFVQLHPLEQWGSSVSFILVLYAGGSSVGHRRDQRQLQEVVSHCSNRGPVKGIYLSPETWKSKPNSRFHAEVWCVRQVGSFLFLLHRAIIFYNGKVYPCCVCLLFGLRPKEAAFRICSPDGGGWAVPCMARYVHQVATEHHTSEGAEGGKGPAAQSPIRAWGTLPFLEAG